MNIFRKLTLSILLSSTAMFASDGSGEREIFEIDGVEVSCDPINVDTKQGIIEVLRLQIRVLDKKGKSAAVRKVLEWIEKGENPRITAMAGALMGHMSEADEVSGTCRRVLEKLKKAGVVVGSSVNTIIDGFASTGYAGLKALRRLVKRASELRS